MAVQKISLMCPQCGANLEVSSDRQLFFCEYCGQKIILSDSNHQKYTYRTIDDARIREAEAKELVRLKEIELEQAKLKAKADDDKRTMKFIFLFMVVIPAGGLFLLWLLGR